jgi:hypothetical protein
LYPIFFHIFLAKSRSSIEGSINPRILGGSLFFAPGKGDQSSFSYFFLSFSSLKLGIS